MRKLRSLLLILAMVLVLAACSGTQTAAWQEQYDLGIQYLTDGDYVQAIVAFTAAIETEPKQAALYIARGDVCSAWAEEALTEALAVLSSEEEAPEWSAITVTASDGNTYTLEELYENAIGDYEEAVSLLESGEALDDSPEALLSEAQEKLEETEKKLEEGRESYEEKLDELQALAGDDTDEAGEAEEEALAEEASVPYFEEYGIEISEQGEYTFPTVDANNSSVTGTTTLNFSIQTTESQAEGTSVTVANINILSTTVEYGIIWFSYYDYYTGICLENELMIVEAGGTVNGSEVELVGEDGETYSCSFSASGSSDGLRLTIMATHSSDYDGLVFAVGGSTGSEQVADYAANDPGMETIFFRSTVYE